MEYLNREEVQNQLIDLIKVFDEVCSKIGISYSLYAGTLLGAVRHKGFIPWDDDIDLCVSRPDYEKLLLSTSSIPDGYSVMTSDNSGFALPFAKFQNNRIRAQESIYEGDLEQYLWLDIFPVDGEDPEIEGWEKRQSKVVDSIKLRSRLVLDPWKGRSPFWKKIAKAAYRLIMTKVISLDELDRFIDRELKSVDYSDAAYVKSLTGCPTVAWCLRKEDFEQRVLIDFEDLRLPAIRGWDQYLSANYGNYMQLPPEGDRQNHGLKAWVVE